jgi:NAD(P)-dependent dehydrogenase (short-subunit alcohol dehydrogenase family)
MDLKLEGKTAFVSGSTAGIGYAIAKRLLLEDASVVINGRTQESVDNAIQDLIEATKKTTVTGIVADCSKAEDVNNVIKQLPEIDILINNVGIYEPKPFAEISDTEWLNMFDTNVMSGIRLTQM